MDINISSLLLEDRAGAVGKIVLVSLLSHGCQRDFCRLFGFKEHSRAFLLETSEVKSD